MIDESTIKGVQKVLLDHFAGVDWNEEPSEDFEKLTYQAAIAVIDWLD